jgi:ABC-type multidrug transport system fused ATPase/permease subunit
LARQWVSIGDSLVRLKRIKDVLDMPAESSAPSPRKHDVRFRKSLCFNDVGFGYKPGKPTLKNASFSISPGEAIALVGPSGSGKTTTAYLMLRLFEPTSGEILLDGHDVRSLPIQDYRDLFAFVPQDTLLQNATIRENLLLNNPDAFQADLEDACRAAHVHDFILKLPNGYDAAVGQGGHHFSGGERQRLAIARALLSKPAVMIMDEPTSALDAETERLVIRDLRDYLGDETALMLITHRPSVSKEMDRILTVNGGRIGDSDQIPAIGFRPRGTLSVFPPSLGHC